MLVAGLTAAAIAFAADALLSADAGRPHRATLLAAAVSAALAVLAKGLIGIVLPLLVIAGWLLATRRWRWARRLVWWPALLLFAAVEIAIPWLFLASAEQRLSSSLAGLLIAAVPLVGALVAWGTGGERLGPLRQLGLLVGLLGVAALVGLLVYAQAHVALFTPMVPQLNSAPPTPMSVRSP